MGRKKKKKFKKLIETASALRFAVDIADIVLKVIKLLNGGGF